MTIKDPMDARTNHLKEACKLCGAHWAVWLTFVNGHWQIGSLYGWNKSRQGILSHLLESSRISTWLAGALSNSRMRWKEFPETGLGCRRIYLFPVSEEHRLLVLGMDSLDHKNENILRIITRFYPTSPAVPLPTHEELPNIFQDAQQPVWQVRAELESSYNPQTILDNILEYLSTVTPCNAVYLAIRSGDIFRIQATWNCLPTSLNLDLSISKNQVIEKITTNRQGLILTGSNVEQQYFLPQVTEIPSQSWMGIPIVIGQRVIGLAVYVNCIGSFTTSFNPDALSQAAQHVTRLAYNVENAIVFAEATRYLQQLALLNELAVTASLSFDVNEVSRRVMQRLRRAFEIDWAAVYLISPIDDTLREYGADRRDKLPVNPSVETSLVGYTVTSGQPVRINDLQHESRFISQEPEICSEMAVPLRYRGKVVGAIDLVSKNKNAFSNQDELLLVLIAGHLAGLFENARLYDELRAYIRQLEDSQRALVQAEKMAIAGRLTASIAHEINNPLQAVSNCLHLAGRKELSAEDRQNYLDLAKEELDRLTQTVQRMLDFYRPGVLDRQPTDIHVLLHKVLSLMEKQFSDHSINIQLYTAPDLPLVYVVGDQIQQVFLNLALNAVEAMPDGGDLVIETSHNQDQVKVIFQDNGPGVPARRKRTIFEPFVSGKLGGTGLGLTISYGIITAHGGSLELLEEEEKQPSELETSPSHQGARFQITLRCSPPPDAEATI